MLWLYVFFYRYYLVADAITWAPTSMMEHMFYMCLKLGRVPQLQANPCVVQTPRLKGVGSPQLRGTPRRDRSLNPLASPSMDPLQHQYQLDIRAEDAVAFLRHRALSNLTALQDSCFSCFLTCPSYVISSILCFCWTSRSTGYWILTYLMMWVWRWAFKGTFLAPHLFTICTTVNLKISNFAVIGPVTDEDDRK